eukprot:scaffold237899_cov18-Prasinocladus_malaysianus.AAC.2
MAASSTLGIRGSVRFHQCYTIECLTHQIAKGIAGILRTYGALLAYRRASAVIKSRLLPERRELLSRGPTYSGTVGRRKSQLRAVSDGWLACLGLAISFLWELTTEV